MQAALALSWNASEVRVRCPFNCPKKVHRHGSYLPSDGRINVREAHCGIHTVDENIESTHYRIVYPFEDDPLTTGLWWILDRTNGCWRTIGWDIVDPELADKYCTEQNVLVKDELPVGEKDCSENEGEPQSLAMQSQDANKDGEDPLLTALQNLNLQSQELEGQSEEKESEGCFPTGDVVVAGEVAENIAGTGDGAHDVPFEGDKLTIAGACESPDSETIGLLLKYDAAEDTRYDTAVLAALAYGLGRVARDFIQAGDPASGFISNRHTVMEATKKALESHERMAKYESHPACSGTEVIQSRLDERKQEMQALQEIIQLFEVREAQQFAKHKMQRLVGRHGEEQARLFMESSAFDHALLAANILRKMIAIPIASKTKTVACLTRGTYLPYTFAVSGYTPGFFGEIDGTIDRPLWTRRVFQLSKLSEHELRAEWSDNDSPAGSYLACHSEKQLLAFLIWNHTTAMEEDGDGEILERVRRTQPPSLSKLRVNIFVGQTQQKKAEICPDCLEFCRKVAERFDLNLHLWGVRNTQSWLLSTWPQKKIES